jgi:5-methylcytosine-specific restriction endonuclease McrA
MTAQLSRIRNKAYRDQSHRCFYCNHPMWLTDVHAFAATHQLTLRQAKFFKCTAEHLHARRDGGGDQRANLVAACATCNHRRHQRPTALEPKPYLRLVRARVSAGRWYGFARPNPSLNADVPHAGCARQRAAG